MGTATVFAWLRLSAQWLDADQQGPRYGAGAGASRAAPTRAHAAVAALVAVSLGCRTVQGVTVAQGVAQCGQRAPRMLAAWPC
jgi:hypothetical protein